MFTQGWVVLTTCLALASPDVDHYGDPLPKGAVMRLGTARLKHGATINVMAFSPDGKRLASCCSDTLRVWEVKSGKELLRIDDQGGHTVAWTRKGTGLIGALGPTIFHWDARDGKVLREFPKMPSYVTRVAMSKDDRLLAAGDAGGNIYLWDLETGKRLHHLSAEDDILSVAFSPDGKRLAAGTARDAIHLWETASGKQERSWHRPQIHSLGTRTKWRAVAFSLDGKRLLATGNRGDGKLAFVLFDPASDLPLLATREKDKEPPIMPKADPPVALGEALVETEKGPMIVLGDGVGLIDPVTKPINFPMLRAGHTGTIAVSPDGKVLALEQITSIRTPSFVALQLWDLEQGRPLHAFEGHHKNVSAVKFSHDGRTILSGGDDGTIHLWDASTGRHREALERDVPIKSLAVSSDGKRVAAIGINQNLDSWTLTDRQHSTIKVQHRSPTLISFLSPSRCVIADSYKHCWPVGYDLLTGKNEPFMLSAPYVNRVTCHAATRDGKWVALGTDIDRVILLDTETHRELGRLAVPGTPLTGLAFTPDKMLLVGVSQSRGLIVWDLPSRRLLQKSFLPFLPHTMALSPCGTRLAVAEDQGRIGIYDTFTAQEIGRLTGHESSIRALDFSPDGRRLVSAENDYRLLVWDTMPPDDGKGMPLAFARLWDDLGSEDLKRAYRAASVLNESPSLLAELADRLLQRAKEIRAREEPLIADLNHDRFKVRQHAFEELTRMGPIVANALRRAATEDSPLEQRRRAQRILASFEIMPLGSEALRLERAKYILRESGTVREHKLLDQLELQFGPKKASD